MRPEHVVISIIILLVMLLAVIALSGKIMPTFTSGLDAILRLVNLK
ncbi:MAG: hypothetical protein HY518_00335 [Candidatus Aenigmarchaeota archaeon]|nr:hypothetical protein [Candidatus Aenigmarchaeota archaeon]